MQTIVDYLMTRIQELGVSEVFGVPGDYNFKVVEAVENNPSLKWIGCCNELNAGYAADGYSRIRGLGAIVTTYGVGELSAVNAVAGAYSESVPLVKIVGMPQKCNIDAKKIFHHCMNSNYNVFKEIYSNVTAYSVILDSENAQEQIEQALMTAVSKKRPVYIGLHDDICNLPLKITTTKFEEPKSDSQNLKIVLEIIKDMLDKSKRTVILSEYQVLRHHLEDKIEQLALKTGYYTSTMMMGKGSTDETAENFIGTYAGSMLNPKTNAIIENADCILGFGVVMTDFNTGCYSAKLDINKFINIQGDYVEIQGVIYNNIRMQDVLNEIIKIAKPQHLEFQNMESMYKNIDDNANLTQNYIYYFMQNFLDKNNIFATETGLSAKGSLAMRLKRGVTFCSQSLWGSIGWATPAILGMSLADRTKRPVLLTGEGSHQMTIQEIGTIARNNLSPIIIVVNNQGYTIERLLCKNPMDEFNEIAKFDYKKLAEGFTEGKVKVFDVKTKEEFKNALNYAKNNNEFVYIEAHTKTMDAPFYAQRFSSNICLACSKR